MNENLIFLKPEDITFSLNNSGLIMASVKGKQPERCAVLRMFPFKYEDEYLCVRYETYKPTDKEEEIGIIRRLTDFHKDQTEIILTELEKRYFTPSIIEVLDLSEEYGHTMWKVKTTAGEREFTLTDMSSNIINLGQNKIMLVDVYQNRYYIPDITKVDDKTAKIIEIWI